MSQLISPYKTIGTISHNYFRQTLYLNREVLINRLGLAAIHTILPKDSIDRVLSREVEVETRLPLDVLCDEFSRLEVDYYQQREDRLFRCTTQIVNSLFRKTEIELKPAVLAVPIQDDLKPIRIQILALIETGGHGAVYQALHGRERVAIKIPRSKYYDRSYMVHEAIVINRLRGMPHVQQKGLLYSLDGVTVYVSELRKGDLQTLNNQYQLPNATLCSLASKIYQTTMNLIERDIYHLDNRVENILWDGDFPFINIYLTDFETAFIAPETVDIGRFLDLHTYNGAFSIRRNISTSNKELIGRIFGLLRSLDQSNYQHLRSLLKKAALFNLAATLYETLTNQNCITTTVQKKADIEKNLKAVEGLDKFYREFILDTLYQ